jgi:hypothetical protein
MRPGIELVELVELVELGVYGVVGMIHVAGAQWAATPGQSRRQLVADAMGLISDGVLGVTAIEAPPPRPPR